jgi:hypothetical protein
MTTARFGWPALRTGRNVGSGRRMAAGRALMGVTLVAALVTGCGDPIGNVDGEYRLASINTERVPTQNPFAEQLQIVEGRLILRADGTAEETMTIRCRQNLPPGTQCQVAQPELRRTGTYSRAENWIRLGGSAYAVEFVRNRVTIEFTPASPDDFSRATFVYER